MGKDGARSGVVWQAQRLCFALLMSAGALSAQQQQGNIVGEIRLVDGTFPSERLPVTLETHGSVVDVTYCDSEGRFGFRDLLPNSYNIVIETEGFQPVHQSINVNPTITQVNFAHVVLRTNPSERPRAAPDGPVVANPDMVDVAELKRKFPPEVIKEFEAGKRAERRGEMGSAVRLYEAALQKAPGFYPALNNLGIRHLQKGDLKSAESEFRRVIELNQNGAQGYFNLGNVLYMTRRDQEAKQALEAGLRLAPSSAMGHYLNGSVLARLGDFKAAEEQLKTAGDLAPRMPQVPISLATLYLQSGRDHEAAAMFEAFLREFPKDPMAPKVRAALSKITQSSSP
jgi:Flp pilus assembly protein TadD